MTLHITTAHYGYAGPDRFDITRVGADRARAAGQPFEGANFAPSSRLLWPAKANLDLVAALSRRAAALPPGEAAATVATHATTLLASVEDAYARLYTAEMRHSYQAHRGDWKALLARPAAVLVCFCPHREPGAEQRHTCHRHHLASYLVACGAVDDGELELVATPSRRRQKPPLPLETLVAVSGTRPPPADASREHRALYADILCDVAGTISELPEGTTILHGGADGVDTIANQCAEQRGLPRPIVVRPWYDAFGKSAPLVRNAYVCAVPRLLAWPSPWGSGTQRAVALARAAGVEVDVRPPR